MTTELWQLEAAETARLVRERTVSAAEVTEAHISRIDAVNGKLNAIVVRTDEHARAQASLIDNGSATGPLAGVALEMRLGKVHVVDPVW
ncbi:MAG: hypothetical protein ACOYKG_08265 [Ilumatobacteraceae bacterium]